jgi:signal transduction histidine kinase
MNFGKKLNEGLRALFDTIDRYVPEHLLIDPESARRGRLITRFGLLGSIFGLIYAVFYLLIGHYWGAGIIILCTLGIALTPSIMYWRKSVQPAGHFFAFTLTLGFLGLCGCEGGASGHALAWLVSVPLCALLLLGQRGAVIWLGLAFLAAALVVGCDLAGINLPKTYPPKWESIISAAGYLGLVVFMSILGLIFERGRATAYNSLQRALLELNATNERLLVLNHEKSEFLGMAAHDLKNPLTVIMANGDMIKIIKDTKALDEMADQIISASRRMHQLIKDLLDTNAIEEGRYASKIEACDLGQLVGQIVKQNLVSAERKQIDIRLGVPDGFLVRTDAASTLQILDNLISNAVKYSPQNSTVHVHLLPEKGHALVQVRDQGPGISDEDQKKLFQKYVRLTARPTGGESSTGLGLSIAKRLAQTLGGDIHCHSAMGAGSTFTLRLPLQPHVPASIVPVFVAGESVLKKPAFALHRN